MSMSGSGWMAQLQRPCNRIDEVAEDAPFPPAIPYFLLSLPSIILYATGTKSSLRQAAACDCHIPEEVTDIRLEIDVCSFPGGKVVNLAVVYPIRSDKWGILVYTHRVCNWRVAFLCQ
ncbi:MAG: hypothetical protein ACLUVG_06925 [Phocaeicola vulgatus]